MNHSRVRLLVVMLVLSLPVFIVPLFGGDAAGALPERIPVLGGSKAYIPAMTSPTMFWGSILVGVIAGLITGVIGAGGGYVLTPALMSFGVRGIMAVGTDQFHLFAKAIMGTAIHRRMGNVNFALAAWFVGGSTVGVTVGGAVNRAVFQYNPALSDALISFVYVVVLGGLSVAVIVASARSKGRSQVEGPESIGAFASWLQSLPLRPRIRFDERVVPGGRTISVYPVILCGLIVGFVASIMGVGGGFLTFPMFVYGLGVSTLTTVGTDILQIIFTTFYSSIFQYALYGYVFYTIAVGMLLGSLLGVQIGALVTRMVDGARVRVFYALTVLAGFVNRLFALPRKLADLGYISMSRPLSTTIESIGAVAFFGIVGVFSVWIVVVFCRNIGATRASAGATGLVVDSRRLALGAAGLAVFAVVYLAVALPAPGGQSVLGASDSLFNSLAKGSTDYIAVAERRAKSFVGVKVDFGLSPREFADRQKLVAVSSRGGAVASVADDGRLRIKADLGLLAASMLSDARLAFDNDAETLRRGCGLECEEALYCWWVIADSLAARCVQENRTDQANFLKYVSTRALEPAYNFRGIEARDIRGSAVGVTLLLLAYVAFTLWYGFSLLLVLEGLGVRAA